MLETFGDCVCKQSLCLLVFLIIHKPQVERFERGERDMPVLNTSIPASYIEEFSFKFDEMLHQRGSLLMGAVTIEPVIGFSKILRQVNVGKAVWVDEVGGPNEYASIAYGQRILTPHPMKCTFSLDKYDLVRQGLPDVGMLAQEASEACGVLIDQLILSGKGGVGGITGAATGLVTGNSTVPTQISLPTTQYIEYDNVDLGSSTDVDNNAKLKEGLSTSKIATAVQMLRSKWNTGPIVCVASNYAMSTLRADPRAASSLFNVQPALASGFNTPYAGCDYFIPCEQVARNMLTKKSDSNTTVEYAYVYSRDLIKLGESMPLSMEGGTNVERDFNQVISFRGMYDCVRMQEEGVVVIEVNPKAT
jgi:hypothetical protein